MNDKFDITGLIILGLIIFSCREHFFPDGFSTWFLDKIDAICHKFSEMIQPVMEDN